MTTNFSDIEFAAPFILQFHGSKALKEILSRTYYVNIKKVGDEKRLITESCLSNIFRAWFE